MPTLALLLAGLASAPLTLDVHIYRGTELSDEILAAALHETQRVFEPGGPAVRPPLPANTCYPLRHIELEPGYVGAVALELPDTECSNLPRVELLEYTSGLRAESAHVV